MNTKPMQHHPAADLFPLLKGDDFESLKRSIAEQGLLTPIVLCDGKILDGRNRYYACDALGVEVRTENYDGDSPVAHVWALNGERRHLTKSQRAAIAVEMLPEEVRQPGRRGVVPALHIPDEGLNFASVVSQLERDLILRCLEKTGGNKRQAARLLNLSRTTLIDKLHRLNVAHTAA